MHNLVEHSERTGIRGAEDDPREAFASGYGRGDPVWTASCKFKPVLVGRKGRGTDRDPESRRVKKGARTNG
jgi:hypothetical protein